MPLSCVEKSARRRLSDEAAGRVVAHAAGAVHGPTQWHRKLYTIKSL